VSAAPQERDEEQHAGCDQGHQDAHSSAAEIRISDAARELVARLPWGVQANGAAPEEEQDIPGEPGFAVLDTVAPEPDDPMAVAHWLGAAWAHPDGVPVLAYWREGWLRWSGRHWAATRDQLVRAELYRALETRTYLGAPDKAGRRALLGWKPGPQKINGVLDAARVVYEWPDERELDTWLQEWAPADLADTVSTSGVTARRIALANGTLDPATGILVRHTPRYLAAAVLPFGYDPAAPCPRWQRYLDEVFESDPESVALLQEWFGYVVSGRTDLHTMLYVIGRPRSGKGTMARVLTALLGGAVAAPTLGAFGERFGLSPLIGMSLAIVGDARSSVRIDTQALIERLLSITGEDAIGIDRKNQAIWTGVLRTRVMMLSNELPWFRDSSGAITGRLAVLRYRGTVAGREDRDLDAVLRTELSGILNWSLVGLRRLDETGRFTVPAASATARAEIREHTSPIGEFIAERCVVGPEHSVSTEALFTEWVIWGGEKDQDRAAQTRFGRALFAALPELEKDSVMVAGQRSKVYRGIGLH
jgi:putative DNA primase/helicase